MKLQDETARWEYKQAKRGSLAIEKPEKLYSFSYRVLTRQGSRRWTNERPKCGTNRIGKSVLIWKKMLFLALSAQVKPQITMNRAWEGVLEWQPQGHVNALVFSLRSFFSLGACSWKATTPKTTMNQGILHTQNHLHVQYESYATCDARF
jgi:hypothetical protein